MERILDVSLELFMKKGYENTSVKEIVDNLGGLTKGAIYHHFKSKEEILYAVSEKIYESLKPKIGKIRKDKSLTGLEKLRKMFKASMETSYHEKMFAVTPMLLNNPNLLAIQLKEIVESMVPEYIQPVIEDGILDGSIKTEYPKELGEVIMLLCNIWLNPLVYSVSKEEMLNKIKFYDVILKGIGINILDNDMYNKIMNSRNLIEDK